MRALALARAGQCLNTREVRIALSKEGYSHADQMYISPSVMRQIRTAAGRAGRASRRARTQKSPPEKRASICAGRSCSAGFLPHFVATCTQNFRGNGGGETFSNR